MLGESLLPRSPVPSIDDRMGKKGKRKAEKGAWGMPVALGGDEGRDKLRKAAVRGKCPPTRGCPNGETRRERSRHGFKGSRANAGNRNIPVPAGRENNNDCASSGERTRKSPNRGCGNAPRGVVGPPAARGRRIAERAGERGRRG